MLLELRAHLDRLQDGIDAGDELTPGDLVQLKPAADRVYGGMIMRVTRVLANRVDGYLLRPHRCGVRIAWHHRTPPEVTRLGRVVYPEADWGFRGFWSADEQRRAEAATAADVPKLEPLRELRGATRRRS